MNTLNELLVKTAQKDQYAFQELYNEVSPRLLNLSVRYSNYDRGAAEDVLQEAFIKIWNKADKFDAEKGTAMTWLSRIVRNQALDKLRSFKSRPVLVEHSEYEGEEYISKDLTPEKESIQIENLSVLKKMIDALPEKQQRCLSLSMIYGYTHEEVAEETQIPLGTVKSHIRRTLNKFRESMEPCPLIA